MIHIYLSVNEEEEDAPEFKSVPFRASMIQNMTWLWTRFYDGTFITQLN